MDDRIGRKLNCFFVSTFNKILAWEERALRDTGIRDLSVKELHILEAVWELEKAGDNTMSKISAKVEISVGALTTAANVLVRKGYLVRSGREDDRRIVLIRLTEKGRQANAKHEQFHKKMIEKVSEELTDSQLETLTESLDRLTQFFTKEREIDHG